MSRTVRILVAAALVAAAAIAVHSGSASAGHNAGVRSVDFRDGSTACFAGDLCTPGSGNGISNTIYVTQSLVDGEYRYTDVVGTAHNGDVWMAVSLGAECRTGYEILRGHVELGHSQWEGWNDPDEWTDWSYRFDARAIKVGSKKLHQRAIPMNLPVDEVLEDLFYGGFPRQEVFAHGEETFQLQVDLGMSPEEARSIRYESVYHVPMHAEITCKGNVLFGIEREMHDSATLPVQIVWLGAGEEPDTGWRDAELPEDEPARPAAPDLPITARTEVTEAYLSVIPDAEDGCLLHLSGVVVANGETDVTYRFVDQLGVHSQQYTTTIDQTFSAMFDHPFRLEPTPGPGDDDGPWISTEQEVDLGQISIAPTDRHRGLFRLEVLAPNSITSAVASYDVPPCHDPDDDPPAEEPGMSAPVVPTTTTVPTMAAPSTTVPGTTAPGTGSMSAGVVDEQRLRRR